jgi:endoglucanase
MKVRLNAMALSLPLAALVVTASLTNPPKLATSARLDLSAASGVGALNEGAIVIGTGTLDRQTWRPAAEWPRTYTISLPIVRFAWNKFAVRFTPANSGSVQLSFMGLWEEVTANSGNIYKQEVLWDALQVTGTTISNGSFETLSGGVISGWSGGVSQTGTAAVPAADGSRMARTWHNGPMTRNFSVTAGVPVTLQFFARAFIPAGFTDMQRLLSSDTPAHRAARLFMRGVNFGNYLETPSDTWGTIVYTASDFVLARSEGFDHVRLPVAWHLYTGPAPTYTLSRSIFVRADFLVTNALNHGLAAIVNIHNFDDFSSDPPAFTNKFYAIWRQVAAHYSNAPPAVALELLNEPKDAATTAVVNPIYAEALRQIRLISPDRTVFVAPGLFNNITELNLLMLPDGDSNLVATVHNYEPLLFTHQGASWAGADVATVGVQFPGPPLVPLAPAGGVGAWVTNWFNDYNTLPTEWNPSSPAAFRGRLQMVKQWADYFGRPVHVGEFGAFTQADAQSRVNFYREMRAATDECGLGWAIWDWKAGFHYIKNNQPDPPGMREALFPPPRLRSRDRGLVEFDGAIGKTCVVERAWSLLPPIPWQAVSTQVLATPVFSFMDSGAGTTGSAFYRVQWVK